MTDHQAFLGQILKNNDIYYKADPKEWWFPDPKDKAVFGVIEAVLSANLTADVYTVGSKSDAVYVSELTDGIPTTANWKYYAGRCKTAGAKSELRTLALSVTEDLEAKKASEIIEEINGVVEKILSNSSEHKIMAIKELMIPIVNKLEERYHNRGQLPGIQTGFQTLDDIIGGLQPSRLYVIGARPSHGKSAIALNMAGTIADHTPVGFLSLESSWEELVMREISSESGINSQRLTSGFFTESDMGGIMDASGRITKKNLFIYDKPNCSIQEIIGQCRRMVNRFKVKVLFIDYLQIIKAPGASRYEQVSAASLRMKDLARELKVPIVILAQLGRDSDGRRPRLGDFQHSSQIEQDADVGILIWRFVQSIATKERLKKDEVEDDNYEEYGYCLLVDKNRDGRRGIVKIKFKADIVTFKEELMKDGNGDHK